MLLRTLRDLTDAQARERTTVSELCLGGVIKHVTRMEQRWAEFIVGGPAAMATGAGAGLEAHAASFRMSEGETLAALLANYEKAATGPMTSWRRCLRSTTPNLSRPHPGSHLARVGRRVGFSCT